MPTALLVTIEQAALNALATWLRTGLGSEVTVLSRWADPSVPIASLADGKIGTVTAIRAGDPKVTSLDPAVTHEAVIHEDVSARIDAATITDTASANTALNLCRTSYEVHRIDTGAHASADTTNALAAPAATDLASGIALATDLLAKVPAHVGAAAHANADTLNTLSGVAAPTNPATLVTAAQAIVRALNSHYVARLYFWRVAEIDQPVQLDVWCARDVHRDHLVAALVPLLHADPGESADFTNADPVREGVVVSLADGWPGHADFFFDAPRLLETSDGNQRSEYRAAYRGTLQLFRLVKKQGPRMARIQLQLTPTPGQPSSATVARGPGDTLTTTFTPG